MMDEDRFWLLVSLRLSGEATEDELSELRSLLQEHPEMGLRVEILGNMWRDRQQGPHAGKRDAYNRHLQRLSAHLSEPVLQYEASEPGGIPLAEEPAVRRRSGYRWMVWAGSVAACIVVCLLLWRPGRTGSKGLAVNTISTKPGSKSKVQLPDGSQVWLNADSRLTYNEAFSQSCREVTLSGEAYFDIIKDKEHPFIIRTSTVDIRVLGTTLNVRSYGNENNTEAVLIRGSVEVSLRGSPERKILLKPNERLTVRNNKTTVVNSQVDTDARKREEPMIVLDKAHYRNKDTVATEILWVKNKLVFDGETLENVALKIERWYNVKVVITSEDLKKTVYSGVFEDESLRQVMEALQLSGNFRYAINKKEITIRP